MKSAHRTDAEILGASQGMRFQWRLAEGAIYTGWRRAET